MVTLISFPALPLFLSQQTVLRFIVLWIHHISSLINIISPSCISVRWHAWMCLFLPTAFARESERERESLAHRLRIEMALQHQTSYVSGLRSVTLLLSSPPLQLPLSPLDDGYIRPVTFWVVGDFDQPSGRQLLYDAIRHMVWWCHTDTMSL